MTPKRALLRHNCATVRPRRRLIWTQKVASIKTGKGNSHTFGQVFRCQVFRGALVGERRLQWSVTSLCTWTELKNVSHNMIRHPYAVNESRVFLIHDVHKRTTPTSTVALAAASKIRFPAEASPFPPHTDQTQTRTQSPTPSAPAYLALFPPSVDHPLLIHHL